MEELEWADVDLDGREEGFLSSRRDPGVLAQSVDRRRGEGVGGCSLLQSLALRLPTERWGEGTHGGLKPYDSPCPGCGVSLRGHLVQSGPPPPKLPEVRPQTEACLLRRFSALLCGISLSLSRTHGFLFRTGSNITLLSSLFPLPLGTLGWQ